MNLEIKQKFVNGCNTLKGDEFLSNSCAYLKEINTKSDLDDFVKIIIGMYTYKEILAGDKLAELCSLIRDKIYYILLENGNIPENFYISLFDYFNSVKLEIDSRFEAYESFVASNIDLSQTSDIEKVYFAVLGFVSSFVNSKDDALDNFLFMITKIHLNEAQTVNFTYEIINFLDTNAVSIDNIYRFFTKALTDVYYFSLSKTYRRSLLNWGFHCFWSAKKLFNHLFWADLYPYWKAIFYKHINRDECDEAMFVHFVMYHKMGNSYQTLDEWKVYNEDISRVGGAYYKDWGLRHNLPAAKNSISRNGKIIIGFLQDRLVENSPYKVQYSVWKNLMGSEEFKNKYEIRVYLMSYFEKSPNDHHCIEALQKIGISVWDGAAPFYQDGFYHSHLNKALFIRDKILEDGVDILISPNNGYDISDFLVSVRCAPKQLFWCHGNFEYDIDGIDKKITHIGGIDPEYGITKFDYMTDKNFSNPVELQAQNKARAKAIRSIYEPDTIFFGTIGRLIKIDTDDFIGAIAEILRQTPKSVYLACGNGNIDSIKGKLEKYQIDSNRFVFTDFVDPHVYGYVIDVYLNSFPQASGEALSEFLSKEGDRYVVNMEEMSE